MQNLQDIWDIVTEWEAFEKKVNIEKIQDVNVLEISGDMKDLKEKIHLFAQRQFDMRIEIHLTLQNKLNVFESNFSLLEDFKSQAIKTRHWHFISKVCGFDAFKDDELVINRSS